jgi:hypothetical protein
VPIAPAAITTPVLLNFTDSNIAPQDGDQNSTSGSSDDGWQEHHSRHASTRRREAMRAAIADVQQLATSAQAAPLRPRCPHAEAIPACQGSKPCLAAHYTIAQLVSRRGGETETTQGLGSHHGDRTLRRSCPTCLSQSRGLRCHVPRPRTYDNAPAKRLIARCGHLARRSIRKVRSSRCWSTPPIVSRGARRAHGAIAATFLPYRR